MFAVFAILNQRKGDTDMTSQQITHMSPKMMIVWQVLEAAKDAGDQMVIAACRRLIVANRIGWKKHANPADYRLVLEFAN
jgi:hypothetical protein